MKEVVAVIDQKLSKNNDKRYVIIDKKTGKVLDDAQGCGYKSPQKAHAAFAYKNRDKKTDAEKKSKLAKIRDWARKHKSFMKLMDEIAFEISKGSWGPDDKFDTKMVKKMLKDNNLVLEDFTAVELLRYWQKH